MSAALVVFSGGQDSTTCLALALQQHAQVRAICFAYNQRHAVEIEQAKIIATKAGVPLRVMDVSWMAELSRNALTDHKQPIDASVDGLPSTFVPGRNHIFLSLAALEAYRYDIEHLYTGVCQTDYSGYPDCRETFIAALNQTLNLAMDTQVVIHTPLMHLTKAQSVQLMVNLDKLAWLADSHTCYEGHRPACGQCPACELRLKGFAEAGIKDPLAYA